jgi:hypothetical protein
VIIDGVDATPDAKQININIDNNINELSVDVCEKIQINGNVHDLKTSSGDVYCANVTGNVQSSSGDVECGDVGGNVQTSSGDVKCDIVQGSVKTMSGDIKHRK